MVRGALLTAASAAMAPFIFDAARAAHSWRDRWLFGRLSPVRPRPARAFELREVRGELWLGTEEEGPLLELNESAADIFVLCDGQRTVADAAAAMRGRYDATEAQLRRDVALTVRELVRLGVLVV